MLRTKICLEVNYCFSIIFKGECEKLEENLAEHEKQMSLNLAIMPRNPIITVHGDYNAEFTSENYTKRE